MSEESRAESRELVKWNDGDGGRWDSAAQRWGRDWVHSASRDGQVEGDKLVLITFLHLLLSLNRLLLLLRWSLCPSCCHLWNENIHRNMTLINFTTIYPALYATYRCPLLFW